MHLEVAVAGGFPANRRLLCVLGLYLRMFIRLLYAPSSLALSCSLALILPSSLSLYPPFYPPLPIFIPPCHSRVSLFHFVSTPNSEGGGGDHDTVDGGVMNMSVK